MLFCYLLPPEVLSFSSSFLYRGSASRFFVPTSLLSAQSYFLSLIRTHAYPFLSLCAAICDARVQCVTRFALVHFPTIYLRLVLYIFRPNA